MESEENPPNPARNIWRMPATICVFFVQKQRNANKISVFILWYLFLLRAKTSALQITRFPVSGFESLFVYLFIISPPVLLPSSFLFPSETQ